MIEIGPSKLKLWLIECETAYPVTCTQIFQVRLAITSVWKVRFQQFKHFPVANNELLHIICLNQK